MPLTPKELEQLEIAKKFPADVLREAVLHQAANNVHSEAACWRYVEAYTDAAHTARARREEGAKHVPQMIGGNGII